MANETNSEYTRELEFGRERRFHEYGVAVRVTEPRDNKPGLIIVRPLEPCERYAHKKKGLTKRRKPR